MKADMFEKMKEAEARLQREQEPQQAVEIELKGKLKKMAPDKPETQQMIQRMKEDRIRYETRLREEAEKKKLLEQSKIKKAKRLSEKDARDKKEKENKKIRASLAVAHILNSEVEEARQKLGKILTYIESNKAILEEKPYFRIKMARTRRMLTAYYFGLRDAGINPKLFEEQK